MKVCGHAGRGGEFDGVALSVVERKSVALKAFTPRDAETGSRIEPSAQ
jgi:hypothetical protein